MRSISAVSGVAEIGEGRVGGRSRYGGGRKTVFSQHHQLVFGEFPAEVVLHDSVECFGSETFESRSEVPPKNSR